MRSYLGAKQGCCGVGILRTKKLAATGAPHPLVDFSAICEGEFSSSIELCPAALSMDGFRMLRCFLCINNLDPLDSDISGGCWGRIVMGGLHRGLAC